MLINFVDAPTTLTTTPNRHHVQGADMAEMVTAFDWLKDEVISHDHDVSFVGDTIDVLFHAQHMLTDRLVTMTPSPDMAAML